MNDVHLHESRFKKIRIFQFTVMTDPYERRFFKKIIIFEFTLMNDNHSYEIRFLRKL